jgi:DNA-binding ferritin-like protein (Dps family)|tara:strand:- start:2985 stop:3179 length:195 start_codon:yes stop_codon:yes gene_type:complete
MSAEKKYLEILKKEQERNELLKELEDIVGFDVSFSDEMVMQNARDAFAKAYDKELKEKLRIWMK